MRAAFCIRSTLSLTHSVYLSVCDAIRFGFSSNAWFKLERSRTLEPLCLCGCELPAAFFARRSICRKWDYGERVIRFVTPIDTFERIRGLEESFLSLNTHTLLKVYSILLKRNILPFFQGVKKQLHKIFVSIFIITCSKAMPY
jgi:hypothetical protein